MGAFTPTVVSTGTMAGLKATTITATGPASYDTGGSILDVGTTALGAEAGFTQVDGIMQIGIGSAATNTMDGKFIPGASALLGKIMLRDLTAASDAEATSTSDQSAKTFRFLIVGR